MDNYKSLGKIGIIIQARLGSTRLPGKILKPFHGERTIVDILVENLKSLGLPIVLATSLSSVNDKLEKVARNHGISIFRGSEDDVLSRFVSIIEDNKFDYVVRICADNPFLSVTLLEQLLSKAGELDTDVDYFSFQHKGTPCILTHFGFFSEWIKSTALVKAYQMTDKPLYREHVSNYIYQNPNDFHCEFIDTPERWLFEKSVRLTVDTKEDFNMGSDIYSTIHEQRGEVNLEYLEEYLQNNEVLVEEMSKEIFNNQK